MGRVFKRFNFRYIVVRGWLVVVFEEVTRYSLKLALERKIRTLSFCTKRLLSLPIGTTV